MRLAPSVVFVASLVGTAAAQPAPGAFPFRASAPPPAHDTVTLSFSPVHLFYPMVEVAAEAKLVPKMGVAIILGAGRYGSLGRSVAATSVYEAGGQFNYYMLDNFDGLHAGVEVVYVRFTDTDQNTIGGNSATLGAYVGFKAVASFGATFVAQGGFAVSAYNGQDTNTNTTGTDGRIFPLLNLNLGWSF